MSCFWRLFGSANNLWIRKLPCREVLCGTKVITTSFVTMPHVAVFIDKQSVSAVKFGRDLDVVETAAFVIHIRCVNSHLEHDL